MASGRADGAVSAPGNEAFVVAATSAVWPPAENPISPMRFGSIPNSAARPRTTETLFWASITGPASGSANDPVGTR